MTDERPVHRCRTPLEVTDPPPRGGIIANTRRHHDGREPRRGVHRTSTGRHRRRRDGRAGRSGLSERYVREWLAGMFAAGYLTYDDDQHSYALPAEHAPALATEPGPAFFGGV